MTDRFPMPEEAVELLLSGQRIPKDVARSVFPHDLGKPQIPEQEKPE